MTLLENECYKTDAVDVHVQCMYACNPYIYIYIYIYLVLKTLLNSSGKPLSASLEGVVPAVNKIQSMKSSATVNWVP